MATFKFEGVDELVKKYEKLEKDSEKIIGEAIYKGAGYVARVIQNSIAGIATDNRNKIGTPDDPLSGPKTIQVIGLQKSLGIAKMRNDNSFRNVKIGFDGYNTLKTKRWPNGQPNMMVARSIESGTSWMQKQPFMRKAEQAAKGPCEMIMADSVESAIQKSIGE